MAVNYQIPNWIHGADPAANYAKGFSLGMQGGEAQARIAMERARLNHDATRQALAFTLEQQKAERDSMVEQQKLEVAKAYHQQQTELRQQDLQQKEELIQQRIKQAAAQQMQVERFRMAVASGKDPAQAALEFLPGAPGMGGLLSASLRSQKEAQEYTPQEGELNGQKYLYSKRTGTPHFLPRDKTPEVNAAQMINAADKTLMWSPDMFSKRGLDTNTLSSLQSMALSKAQQALTGKATTNAPAAGKINPWESDPKKVIEGQLYDHLDGIYQSVGKDKDGKPIYRQISSKPQASVESAPEDMQLADNAEPDQSEYDNSEES